MDDAAGPGQGRIDRHIQVGENARQRAVRLKADRAMVDAPAGGVIVGQAQQIGIAAQLYRAALAGAVGESAVDRAVKRGGVEGNTRPLGSMITN